MVSIFKKRFRAPEPVIGSPGGGAGGILGDLLAENPDQVQELPAGIAHDNADKPIIVSDPSDGKSLRHNGQSVPREGSLPPNETASLSSDPSIQDSSSGPRRFDDSRRLVQQEAEVPKFRLGPPDVVSRTSSAAERTDVGGRTELWYRRFLLNHSSRVTKSTRTGG